MIDIKKFVGGNDAFPAIQTPWSDGEKIIATNGHMIIIADRDAVDLKGVGHDGSRAGLNRLTELKDFDRAMNWASVEKYDYVCSCGGFDGNGHYEICNECKGEGCAFNDYDELMESECEEGKIWFACNACCDASENKWHGRVITKRYQKIISELPNVRIATLSDDDEKPVLFRCDGAYGLVSPRRKGTHVTDDIAA